MIKMIMIVVMITITVMIMIMIIVNIIMIMEIIIIIIKSLGFWVLGSRFIRLWVLIRSYLDLRRRRP